MCVGTRSVQVGIPPCVCYTASMEILGENATSAVLRDVAARLEDLDLSELQQEINAIQFETQELNRQMKERHVLLQLKQLEVQRQAERANGMSARVQWRPDREIQRRLDELHKTAEPLDEQA